MAEIIKATKPVHRCYDELWTFQYRTNQPIGYGSVVRCSCGAHYLYSTGNIFTSLWDSLNGRFHTTAGKDIFDRWVEMPRA